MTYRSSTAASSLTNPPRLMVPSIGALASSALSSAANTLRRQGGALWYYSSTHGTTQVIASNFISDGKKLGMHPGDVVMGNVVSTAGGAPITYTVSVRTVSTSGATLAGMISSTAA